MPALHWLTGASVQRCRPGQAARGRGTELSDGCLSDLGGTVLGGPCCLKKVSSGSWAWLRQGQEEKGVTRRWAPCYWPGSL